MHVCKLDILSNKADHSSLDKSTIFSYSFLLERQNISLHQIDYSTLNKLINFITPLLAFRLLVSA